TGGGRLVRRGSQGLDIAALEAGRRTVTRGPVHRSRAITESPNLVRPQAEQRRIEIRNGLAPWESWYVKADCQRLQQVVLNLLSNAVKYNREGGTIFLDGAEQPGGRLRVLITDTGGGLSPESMSKLFVPF